MPAFYEVMIERNFSSAHQLRGYKGKCENLHGHNYKIEIYARGEELKSRCEIRIRCRRFCAPTI